MHWRRKWQPTPVFLPGESQGWRSLVGCHLWGRTESDTTEVTQQQQQSIFNFSNCVDSVCLFFNSSRSLLIDSCIFSFLFSRFLIIYTIIILNSFSSFSGNFKKFSYFLFIYLDFCVSSLFLHLCSISLPFHFF